MNLSLRYPPVLALAFLAPGLLMLSACIRAPNPDTRTEDEIAIRKLDTQWSKDAGAHDLNAMIAYYADDAVLLAPDEPVSVNKPAIRTSWVGTLGAFATLSWEIKTLEVARAGDFAYLTGAWRGTLRSDAGPNPVVTGKLLEIWKKQPDGAWKCVADTFNYNAPANPLPAARK